MKPKLLLLALLSPSLILAQEKQRPWDNIEFYPPSAATLIKALDCPPAHYTGNPEITVPIYTIESSELTMPISLNFDINTYNKPTANPDVAGSGWSLNSDIMITRVINGKDDLGGGGYIMSSSIWKSYKNGDANTQWTARFSYLDGVYDTEPDKFYYRLLNKTGNFFLTPDNKVEVIPYNGVKVEYVSNNKFRITDSDGTVYIFDVTDTTTDTAQGTRYISCWHCSSITSASGYDDIIFEYRAQVTNQTRGVAPRIEVYDDSHCEMETYSSSTYFKNASENEMNNGQVPFENLSGPKIRECRYDYDVLKVYRKDGTWQTLTANRYKESGTGSHSLTVDQRYLQSISWKTGAISLEYGSNGDMLTGLTKLIVKNKQTNTVRTVTFDQSGTREQRKLNSLIIDKDTYSFNYYNRIPPGACVPDYWGYASYSPLLGGSGQIPNHSVDLKIGYQYAISTDGRSDSATPKTATVGTANIGSITQAYSYETNPSAYLKITYPTGGNSVYRFEHQRFDHNGTTGYTSALRLAEVEYRNESGTLKRKKKYEYGSGQCTMTPTSGNDTPNNCTEQELVYVTNFSNYCEDVATQRKRVYYDHPTARASFDYASPVVYSDVTEYDIDVADGGAPVVTGKTQYSFSVSSYYISGSPKYPFPMQPNKWERGHLTGLKQYRYDTATDDYVLLRKVDYSYSTYEKTTNIHRLHIWPQKYPINLSGNTLSLEDRRNNTVLWETDDYLKTGCRRKTGEVETVYSNDGSVSLTRTTTYHYDNSSATYHLPIRMEVSTSDGNNITQYILRPTDYTNTTFSALKEKNIIDVPIEQISVRNGKIIRGELYQYNNSGSVTQAYCHETEPQSASTKFTYSYTRRTGCPYPSAPSYALVGTMSYDLNNKLNMIQRPGKPVHSYVWDGYGVYCLAEVVNATATEVSGAMKYGDPATLQNNLPNALVTVRNYTSLVGLKSEKDPSGRLTSYSYHTGSPLKLQFICDDKGNAVTEYEYSNE